MFAEMRKVMPEAMELSYTAEEPRRPGARMKAMLLDESSEKSKVQCCSCCDSIFERPKIGIPLFSFEGNSWQPLMSGI